MNSVLALASAYTLGSFPSAYLAGKLIRGVDLRTVGSGNLGATNVYREIGAVAAVVVLLLDAAKGWLAVAQAPRWFSVATDERVVVACGAMAVLGHAKPIFLRWRGGGKGVATGAGIFLYLAPTALAAAVAIFALFLAATRFVSAASVAAALTLPIPIGIMHGMASPTFFLAAAVSIFVVWAHRANLRRISLGQESRIGRPGMGKGK
jgi:acyl phosphate:glycerol-3-phosphate acyltransferase